EAAVVARTEGEETELCAYIEGQDQKAARTELGKRLPAYMMPSSFIEMEYTAESDCARLPHRQSVWRASAAEGDFRQADTGRARSRDSGIG
ncbi:hypothetical protein LG208_08305, partial [Bacillus paralicheniformis]